ncbi:hypothetical protein KDI_42110 [Dictyobacter arantiisoli]|uniref:Uncharacterized protein n=1 Tax=Dictyobacter arantiisoli TaxID=2014874 RepID=A0A5A5TH00_9CHLR|nr:hypothetical protein KDI_42110 [Dictyobacter arantiisoli]
MTSIEQTAYPRFNRAPSVKELHTIYTQRQLIRLRVSSRAKKGGAAGYRPFARVITIHPTFVASDTGS